MWLNQAVSSAFAHSLRSALAIYWTPCIRTIQTNQTCVFYCHFNFVYSLELVDYSNKNNLFRPKVITKNLLRVHVVYVYFAIHVEIAYSSS